MSDYNIESMDLSNESSDFFGFLPNNFNMINESSSYVPPHEDGLEYGHNSADIAGDNMAAHYFASDLNGEYNGLGNINTENRMDIHDNVLRVIPDNNFVMTAAPPASVTSLGRKAQLIPLLHSGLQDPTIEYLQWIGVKSAEGGQSFYIRDNTECILVSKLFVSR